jgi:hypothetical protein
MLNNNKKMEFLNIFKNKNINKIKLSNICKKNGRKTQYNNINSYHRKFETVREKQEGDYSKLYVEYNVNCEIKSIRPSENTIEENTNCYSIDYFLDDMVVNFDDIYLNYNNIIGNTNKEFYFYKKDIILNLEINKTIQYVNETQ